MNIIFDPRDDKKKCENCATAWYLFWLARLIYFQPVRRYHQGKYFYIILAQDQFIIWFILTYETQYIRIFTRVNRNSVSSWINLQDRTKYVTFLCCMHKGAIYKYSVYRSRQFIGLHCLFGGEFVKIISRHHLTKIIWSSSILQRYWYLRPNLNVSWYIFVISLIEFYHTYMKGHDYFALARTEKLYYVRSNWKAHFNWSPTSFQ